MNAGLLLRLGLRNLGAHRVKSAVVGMIMAAGAFLVVVGTALLGTIEGTMESSITNSMSGHLQVYSADAKDPLQIFPSGSSGSQDIGEINQVSRVREELLQVENVKDVVPMGITQAIVFVGTELDRALDGLRRAVAAGDADGVAVYSEHVRQIAASLKQDLEVRLPVLADLEQGKADLATLEEVSGDAFWARFAADPDATLNYLDATIAPMAVDNRMLYMRCLGADPGQFTRTFSSFRIVDGQPIPEGEEGILLAKRFYERQVKNLVARELDAIQREREAGATFADDILLREKAKRLEKQVSRLLYQLNPSDSKAVEADLRAALPGVEGGLRELAQAAFTLDDANFDARYALFYDVIAPRIRLYESPVGSTVVLRSFTRSGYMRAVETKVWGTFEFSGLETSDLAGANQLVDMSTFRKLYGRMSAAQQAELADIRASVGIADLSRENAEDALFGGGGSAEAEAALFGEAPAAPPAAPPPAPAAADDDLALNAAIVLQDPTRLGETLAAVKARVEQADLGLEVVNWQAASGIVGQLILVLQGVLTVAILVIFVVALVIINNTMVTTTLERTTEIGTMRAIGATKGFVVLLLIVETVLLGLIAGGAGCLAAVAFLAWLGQVGIPAVADVLVLLFAGPRLYPEISAANVAMGLGSITVVSVFSTLYPALLAAGVSPVVAMSAKE